MEKKQLFPVIFICFIVLASCSRIQTEKITPTPPVTDVEKPLDTFSEQGQEVPTPIPLAFWDDRTVFSQTLSKSGQQYLNALPLASFYYISLTIPDDMTETLTGEIIVRFHNQENTPLEEVYFRLFPNFYSGALRVEDVEVNGLVVETKLESFDTALRVDLAQPLIPGEGTTISMKYTLTLPKTMSGNYGLLGFFEDVLVLDTFYPMIPAYDEDGWCAHYPYLNGDLTYTDASFYLVKVTAPADLIIASSGSTVEKDIQNDVQSLTIASGPARDFYLAGSKNFEVMTREVNGIVVNSFALEGFSEIQEHALITSSQAIEIFSDLFGEYPYREFDVISSPMQALGIEYPGITGIYLGLYDEFGSTYGLSNRTLIESVIAHEVGHQWFYNMVGSNQQSEPWVDEALVQYVTYQYFVKEYGNGAGAGIIQSWDDRWARIEYEEIPIGLIASDYGHSAYSPIVYGRGPLFFLELEELFGEDVLLKGIKDYTQEYLWKTADTEDVRESLEITCDCDLSEMFEEWIYPVE